jgi:hypothetical protein
MGLPLDRGVDTLPHADLRASGLYFSEAPNLWVGRSANKWNFVGSLTPEQRSAISQEMLKDNRFTGGWYLTDSERERAATWLERFTETGLAVYLQLLSEQPYNFPSWRPRFLEPLGISNTEVPHVVPVKVQGSFADISNVAISQDLIIALKLAGHDGAFIRSSMAFLPQAVVWNNSAVVQFGDYMPDTAGY